MQETFKAAESLGVNQTLLIVLVFTIVGMIAAMFRYIERRERVQDEKDAVLNKILSDQTVALTRLEIAINSVQKGH